MTSEDTFLCYFILKLKRERWGTVFRPPQIIFLNK